MLINSMVFAALRMFAIYLFISGVSYLPTLVTFFKATSDISSSHDYEINAFLNSHAIGEIIFGLSCLIVSVMLWRNTHELLKYFVLDDKSYEVQINIVTTMLTCSAIYLLVSNIELVVSAIYHHDKLSEVKTLIPLLPVILALILILFRKRIAKLLES